MLRALFSKNEMHRVAENFEGLLCLIGWLSGLFHGYVWMGKSYIYYLMSSSSMTVSIVPRFLTFFTQQCRTVRRSVVALYSQLTIYDWQ